MSYGDGIYGVGIYGAGTEDASHIGTGQIGIIGQSLIEQNYRAIGVGNIAISDNSVIAKNYRAFGIGQVGITGLSVTVKAHDAYGIGIVGISGQSIIEQNYRAVGAGAIAIADASIIASGISPIVTGWISTHYRCYLTGAPDGLEDIEIKIKSFQTRFGSDPLRIYLSVVVPGADSYIDQINLRPNGRLKIHRIYNYSDGSIETFLMAECALNTISTVEGDRAGVTGQLSGFENYTAGTSRSITLYSPIYRALDSGKRRYRCEIDPRVRPGDSVTINGETLTVSGVVHIIDTKTSIMEIQE